MERCIDNMSWVVGIIRKEVSFITNNKDFGLSHLLPFFQALLCQKRLDVAHDLPMIIFN